MLLVLTAFAAAGCGRDEETAAGGNGTTESTAENLSGAIAIDGSSTVGPLVTAGAESFGQEQPDVRVTVGISGTGGGFERFCAGETDISNASRPIKEDEEVPLCQEAGIEYTELRVATDALTVVVNPENDWVECMTVEQLSKAWAPGAEGKVKSWSDIDPSFPDEPLSLAGPGTDSGTFDYFTDEVNGEEGASRSDYTASEDDNVVVRAVESEKGAMGYFGFSYYEQNQDSLKALEIDGGEGCVTPSVETAQGDEYKPLSRPLYVYVKNESLQRPEVKAFVQYLLDNSQTIAEEALFIPLNDEQLAESTSTFEQAAG
jgi:phosphate transport system substrate-binding protein